MIHVLGDRVLVALPPRLHAVVDDTTGYTVEGLQQTDSGLFVAKPSGSYDAERSSRGIVMQLGEKRGQVDLDDVRAAVNEHFLEYSPHYALPDRDTTRDLVDRVLMQMQPADFDVAVGDCVLFPPHVGDPFTHDGVDYVILYESDIIGILEKERAA